MAVDPALLLALFAVAVLAGMIDAIAGGGGLITIPALLIAGLDPVAAVATNKLQGVIGTASATTTFARAGLIAWRASLPMAVVAFLGSLAGACTAGLLPAPVLLALMPGLLVAIASYFALSRRMRDEDARRKIGPLAFTVTLVLGVGFYDGLFGPGAGSLYLFGLVTLLGLGVIRATAQTKLLNFASNLGGFLAFVALGEIIWPIGLAMGVGALIGAHIGGRLAIRGGTALIRPLLVAVSLAAAVRLLLDPANPLRSLANGLHPS